MIEPTASPLPTNPFCTAGIRPGARPYWFAERGEQAAVLERLERAGWRGQIVGPHGSGKSTMLRSLRPELERRAAVRWVAVLGLELRWPHRQPGISVETPGSVTGEPTSQRRLLVVDGFEGLGWLGRVALRSWCASRNTGLLVTSHRNVGLPTIAECRPNLKTLQQIAERLTAGYPPFVTSVDVSQAYESCGANVREALFRLYDVYEDRRRGGAA
jgi:hypothetical protein